MSKPDVPEGPSPDRGSSMTIEELFTLCAAGDVEALGRALDRNPGLARERHNGTTALHLAVPHPGAVRLLLSHGADPDVRDEGDNALPLHFAAGGAFIESMRLLLDAGSDVHGDGDLHRLEVIGWATVFDEAPRDVVELLVEHGARHHVFSAIALGDRALLRRVVEEDPAALERRLSRYEQEQTALHYCIAPPDGLVGGRFRTGEHYRTLEALIELGADLEALDARGRTPLGVAMLRGDLEAMRLLREAGAKEPDITEGDAPAPSELSDSMSKVRPMLAVADMDATIAWYLSVGFVLTGRHPPEGPAGWASVAFGDAEMMFVPSDPGRRVATTGLSLWINTDRIDELYRALKERQLEHARAELAGRETPLPEVRFTLDLHSAFYGQREFGVRDPNGIELLFAQPTEDPGE